MSVRVQVILNQQERALFQRQAALDGLSLSSWLRNAARERLAKSQAKQHMQTVEELRAFFQRCDDAEQGQEPDWEQHLETIRHSRSSGNSVT